MPASCPGFGRDTQAVPDRNCRHKPGNDATECAHTELWGWQRPVRRGSERGRLARLAGRKGRARRRHFPPGRKGRERIGRSADAGSRARRGRPGQSLVHNPPNGASAAPTFGTASQTSVDLARRSDGAFGCNGSNLMVRNDVARTHNHDGTPSSIRLGACARPSAFICMMKYSCHLAVMAGKYNEVKSL
jgi:hypothetical protein